MTYCIVILFNSYFTILLAYNLFFVSLTNFDIKFKGIHL